MADESEKDLPSTAEFIISPESICNKVHVRENQVFSILIEGNISARIFWVLENPESLNHEKIRPLNLKQDGSGSYRSKFKLPGSSGYEIFKFKAVKASLFANAICFISRSDRRDPIRVKVKVKISK